MLPPLRPLRRAGLALPPEKGRCVSESSRTTSDLPSLRASLDQQRQEIRQLHEKGLPAAQVSAKLASMIDSIVVSFYEQSLAEYPDQSVVESLREKTAIVGLGSYGRRQCAPYSDVDLMILHAARKPEEISALFRPMTQGIFDVGLQLGHSVRTVSEAAQLAREDPVICTSMIDTRLVRGNQPLYDSFRENFAKIFDRNKNSLIRSILGARTGERDEYGKTVYLLEPHVKRSRGGLRDLNTLRWLGFAEHKVSDPDRLHLMGAISKIDHRRLTSTRDFLLRLRNELHFHAGAYQDLLSRAEQLRIAEKFGYLGNSGMLPVEQFMRDYFRHSNHLWQLVRRRDASLQVVSRVSRVLDPVLGKTIDGDFRIGMKSISATETGLIKIGKDLREVLRLVELSMQHNKPIEHATWSTMLLAAPDFPDVAADQVRDQFWELLAASEYVGEALRVLHELGFLEKIIPPLKHARCLLQFNQYHKFTVDEHCIRSVREAARFAERDDVLGQAYREVADKRVLHLALLMHDLGKGFEEDHSEVGLRLANETAELLQLPEQAAADVAFLVHKHLVMSHLTFRRDTSDTQLLKRFANEIGSVERLRMLFVVTCADLASVGPDVLNDWKIDILADVFHRSVKCLEEEGGSWQEAQLEFRRIAVRENLSSGDEDQDWFGVQIEKLPNNYLARHSARDIANVLTRLNQLQDRGVDAWCEVQPDTKTLLFTAGVAEGSGRGVFSSMAGALSGNSLQILSADTHVLDRGLLLLQYETLDLIHSEETPAERIEKVCQALIDSVDSEDPPKFPQQWGTKRAEESMRLSKLSNRVSIDIEASDRCTVVEVFTFDRAGLLYKLARRVHDLELVIQHAKIGTYLDQVVDVFYVTDRQLQKVLDPQQLETVREELLAVIDQ